MKLNRCIVTEIKKMAQVLGERVPKPTRKFLLEIFMGMIGKKTVLLSEIGRFLNEGTALIQTEKRLSYQLNRAKWNVLEVAKNYLNWAKVYIKANSVIAFDMGDITKEYARKSPRLGYVWDGSKKKASKGWWMIKVVCAHGKRQILPLFNYLFHSQSKRYMSHNNQVKRVLEFIVEIIGSIGIWTFDRGFDDVKHFKLMESLKLKFVVRLKSTRHLIPLHLPNLKKLSVQKIAKLLSKTLQPIVFVPVQLPENDIQLTLVIRFYKNRRIYLLTNIPAKNIEAAKYILRSYRQRWSVEDSDRAHKQIFDLENIRSRTWTSLHRLVHLSTWAHAILFCISLLPRRFLHSLFQLVKCFTKPNQVLYYRLADAVSIVLLLHFSEMLFFR